MCSSDLNTRLVMAFDKIRIPEFGEKVTMGDDGELNVSDQPIVTFIEGDGTEIGRASCRERV